MFKRSLAILTLALFSANTLTACGSSNDFDALQASIQTEAVANQGVQAQSFSGVYKEIQNASKLAFKELDRNNDKGISPDEYNVSTPDSAKAFYALDNNHDGKITEKEFSPGFFSRVGLTFRLRSAAKSLFKQLDKSKDKLLSREELTSGLVSTNFLDAFDKFDKQKKTLFHKDAKGSLSLSEFENLFASIAMSNLTNQPAPAPAPADPAPVDPAPADPTPARR